MKTITITELRKHASELLSDVEKGESLLVLRHGKPVAEISPPSGEHGAQPSWKRPGLKLAVKGASLSSTIIKERRQKDAF